MKKYVKEFIEETGELLDQADADLLALEREPEQPELVANLFRALHSIKGGCGLLGYSKTEALTHAGENLLAKVRSAERAFDGDVADALLRVLDATRAVLQQIQDSDGEGDENYLDLIATLIQLRDPDGGPATPAEPKVERPAKPAKPTKEVEPDDTRPEPVTGSVAAFVPERAPERAPEASPRTPPAPRPRAEHRTPPPAGGAVETSVRIDVTLLDKMMNLVGELVLARNQIVQFAARSEDPALVPATQRLNLITSELQEQVMKTRMQPIDKVWSKLPRVVRDLAQSCGKRVRIETEGAETELDRTIIEAIKDPLTHVVRNAVDHGIEPPELRTQLGKPVEGVLSLRAFHEGGQVNIVVSDDGRGLVLERIRQKALASWLVTEEELAELTERETLALIFEPGFSTADKVTRVSGRGVGMDVVKTNVERIGGSLELDSAAGQGTTLRIKIPLTLAILPALIFTCDGLRYAIPQLNVVELVRLKPDQGARVEVLQGTPVYRLRDRLLPLVGLRELFDSSRREDWTRPLDAHVVVLFVDGHHFGLVVDDCIDTQEIVVKPLGHQLKDAALFAGATIMEDGAVALILDALGIVSVADLQGEGAALAQAAPPRDVPVDDRRLLLFVSDSGTRMAMPLDPVSRLEIFPAGSIELVGRRRVVRYGGSALPVAHVDELVGTGSWPAPGSPADGRSISVAVHVHEGRSVGLVLGRILDIVEAPAGVAFDPCAPCEPRDGVLNVEIVAGSPTQLIDLECLLAGFRAAIGATDTATAAQGATA